MSEEDYDIHTLATFLHSTPAQVEKMAGRQKIPGRRVSGQWRFSKSEIHLWFEERIGLGDEGELLQLEKMLETEQIPEEYSIASLLVPSAIWLPLLARTRNSVISQICQQSADAGLIWDVGKMESAIKSREKLHSTALENGVALLHPRRPQETNIGHAFLGLGITTTGLPFGGPRGVMTDVFFLIASETEKGHLQTLARLSRLIAKPGFVDELRECPDSHSVIDLVRNTDESIG